MTTTTHTRQRLTANRVIDHDSQSVQVTLSQDALADLLYGLTMALRADTNLGARYAAQIYGKRPIHDPDSARLRRQIAEKIAAEANTEDSITLDQDEAEDLAEQLSAAAVDAEPCKNWRCDGLADAADAYCAICEDGGLR